MTTIGYPSAPFNEGPGDSSQLGSGLVFLDEAAGAKELAANVSRIEGWRRTKTYLLFQEVCCAIYYFCLQSSWLRMLADVVIWRCGVGFPKISGNETNSRVRSATSATTVAAR